MTKKCVLFLRTENSCRSQMCEGMLRHLSADNYDVASAGINPSKVNPYAIAAMMEIGVDISAHRSKGVDEFEGRTFNFVITVCDNVKENCPYFAGSKMTHWNIDDPAKAKGTHKEILKVFEDTRDYIESLIRKYFLS